MPPSITFGSCHSLPSNYLSGLNRFMITFRTLEHTSLDQLLAVFNHSFSDYITPLQLSRDQLEQKLRSDNVDLAISAGAFLEEELVGFILHGYREQEGRKLAYNAGTGVVPGQRGQGLTKKLYDFIFPLLNKRGVQTLSLEVITGNKPAITVYQSIGFKEKRVLHCYRGNVIQKQETAAIDIRPFNHYDWPVLRSFWEVQPSWQNAITAVEVLRDSNVSIGAWVDGELRGYIILNPNNKRIQQMAVHPGFRRKGIGTALLAQVVEEYGPQLSVINVDAASESANAFLEKAGLERFLSQYEMEMELR